MSKEIWVPVKGYEGRYEVSSLGSIRSLDMMMKNGHGTYSRKKGRTLKTFKNRKGYLQVKLCKDGLNESTVVHRVVAMSFIENKNGYDQVNHLNGIKDDNRVENLEWCSNRQNIIHAYKNGLINTNKGENHHMSKLTNSNVVAIKKRIKKGEAMHRIASDYNVSTTAIMYIKSGVNWSHIKIKDEEA